MPRANLRAAWLLSALFVAFAIAISAVPLRADDDLRTWTDSTGKFKIKAKFIKLDEGAVTLEQEDGSEMEIPLKKLSAADQKVANELAKGEGDNPFKSKKDDTPFKSKPKGSTKGGRKPAADDDDEPESAGDGHPMTIDWSSAEQVSLAAQGDEWHVDPPDGKAGAFPGKPKMVALPKKSGFFEGLKGLAVNPHCKMAAASFVIGEPKPAGTTRVVLCDLGTGKCTPPATASGQMVPLAVHDDGKQIVMRRDEFGFGNQDRMEVWTLKGNKVNRSKVWVPYDDVQGGPRDVMWAEFIDEQHLVTSSRGGKVVVWKFPAIEPEYSFQLADGAVPALSPDRRLIAYSNGTEVGIFDVTKREVVAQQSTPDKLQWPYMAFSPSGKRLGCIAFDKVLVWDVASGKLEKQIPATGLHIHGGIDFPDDNAILGNGKFLIDLENQLKLWTYDGQEQVRCAGGWCFFAVTDGDKKPGGLVPVQLPHPAAKDLLKKALTDPNLFVLKSGTTVTLNVNGIADGGQRTYVQQSLTKALKKIGCEAGPAGSIELVATVEGPKQREISYIGSGDYKVQEWLSKLRFVYQGQPAWETSATNVPGFLFLKKGENIEGKLRESERPNYTFFESVELPKFLQKPTGQGAGNSLTLGQSRLTTNGLK